MSDKSKRRTGWFGWAWRVAVALVLVVVFGHAIWGARSKARFEARLAELRAAGEAVMPEDFAPPAVAGEENAATDLLAAGRIVAGRGEAARAYRDLSAQIPLNAREVGLIGAELRACAEAFPLLRSAAGKAKVVWDIDPATPALFNVLPGLKEARELSNLLRNGALLAHHEGRDDRALEYVDLMRAVARAVDHQPTLVSHLTAVGVGAASCNAIGEIAADLRVGGDAGAVPAERVRALIAELLDERASRAAMLRSYRGERKDQWLILKKMLDGTLGQSGVATIKPLSPGVAYAAKPFVYDDAELLVRLTTALIKDVDAAADFPAFEAGGGGWRALRDEIEQSPRRHMLAVIMVPAYDRTVRQQYRLATDRRLTAVALAARFYAVEHGGALPGSLAELTPKYLPAVPVDPMAAGGQALRFKSGPTGPIVYGVGDDGVDDGGSVEPIRKRRGDVGPPDRWMTKDAVSYLKRQARWVAPAEEE